MPLWHMTYCTRSEGMEDDVKSELYMVCELCEAVPGGVGTSKVQQGYLHVYLCCQSNIGCRHSN